MSERSEGEHVAFHEQMVALMRAFGWHRPDSTPCGKPVPIAEAHALMELTRAESPTQQELAGALNLSKSTVSRLVTNLERRGWIQRRTNGDDARALDVSLTDDGRRAAAELAAARADRMSGILDRIPDGERDSVVRALRTLTEAIHERDA